MKICLCLLFIQDENINRTCEVKISAIKRSRDEELGKLKRLADRERKRLIKEEVTIVGFEKALQRNIGCSHTRTKAWGDKYGSGLR